MYDDVEKAPDDRAEACDRKDEKDGMQSRRAFEYHDILESFHSM